MVGRFEEYRYWEPGLALLCMHAGWLVGQAAFWIPCTFMIPRQRFLAKRVLGLRAGLSWRAGVWEV